jgi:hypothetical protein
MRYLLLIPTLLLTSYTMESSESVDLESIKPIEVSIERVVEPKLEIEVSNHLEIEPLISAMIWVESRGNDSAYCKVEEAAGCLQIRPIMLRECNRILKLQNSNKKYILLDRWNRARSIEIFHVVTQYHNRNGSFESIARFWNGGPRWSKKKQTKKYWNKVKRKLKV